MKEQLRDERNFLKQVLQVTSDSDVDPQAVYPLLQENLALLDENLARVLHEFGIQLADDEAEAAEMLATDIMNFSNLLQEFPLGDQAINQEIAITGYQVALTICSRPINSDTWALIQNNLGLAYFNRIRGERAENLENAIISYQAALEVYTREDFPWDWAMNQ
ncbi:MAG: tetratricopeptide repeat protein, partial [Coleofasciculus sp. C2-GNP5-27]